MPTYSLPLTGFCKRGMNLRDKSKILDHTWAERMIDFWIDGHGILSRRGGFDAVTTTAAAGALARRLHYYTPAAGLGSGEMLVASNNNISGIVNTSTDRVSGTQPTEGYWKFLNFNGAVYAFQTGQTALVLTSVGGNFADQSAASGSLPTGDAACAAFGRLWCTNSDKQTIKYTGLLAPTQWGSSDAGQIDMRNVWGSEGDEVVAIDAVGSMLVVFGVNHIVVWQDGSGSQIGLDPTQMAVTDIIRGTGCIARDTVVPIGQGDLWYYSKAGVQSFRRVLASKNNPLVTISKYCDAAIKSNLFSGNAPTYTLTAGFNPELNLFLLGNGAGVWVFHTARMYEDEEGDLVAPIAWWSHSGTHYTYNPSNKTMYTCDQTFGSVEVLQYKQSNVDEGSQSTDSYLWSYRFRSPQAETQLLNAKGYRVSVYHNDAVSIRYDMIGADDRDDADGSTTIQGIRRRTEAYTDSRGVLTESTNDLWEGYFGTDLGGLYVEEHDVELGASGNWVQIRISASKTGDVSQQLGGGAYGLRDIVLHAELGRNV